MKTALIYLIIGTLLASQVLMSPALADREGSASPVNYSIGVWDNFEFNRSAEDWSTVAHTYGGENAVVDLVVAQAHSDGHIALPFPFKDEESLYTTGKNDPVELYLEKFDSEGLNVILSIQPLNANVTSLMDILLSRYDHHKCIIGINVDLEWKESGIPHYVNNDERDAWLNAIKSHNTQLKLFLTYYEDHTHFPDDTSDLVILFDGTHGSQKNLLSKYAELAKSYTSVGIYTGYSTNDPPTASNSRIMAAAPNTRYIIHTDDVFGNKKIVIFELDDVQVGWLESTSIDLIDLHIKERVPIVLGIIPMNLDNKNYTSYLPVNLIDIYNDYSNLIEISQHGLTHNSTEQMDNLSYDRQKAVIENGQNIFESMDIKPVTFTPPYGAANEDTVKILRDHGFKNLVLYSYDKSLSNSSNLSSGLLVMNSWIYFVNDNKTSANYMALKSPEQLMDEIDSSDNNVVFVLYHIQDFARGSGNSIEKLGETLEALKRSDKYQFMTVSEYHDALIGESTPLPSSTPLPTPSVLPQPSTLPGPNLKSIAAAMVVSILIIFSAGMIYIGLRKRK